MKFIRICKQCESIFLVDCCVVRKGRGLFCSISCGVTFRNLYNNYSKMDDVRKRISDNHADVSGCNNPMFGRKGVLAPSYKDGRSSMKGDTWRRIALIHKEMVCEFCGVTEGVHIHHKDKNRKNNSLDNLQVVCVSCHNNILHKRSRDNYGRFIKEVVC